MKLYLSNEEMDSIDSNSTDWVNPVPSSAVQQQIGDACVKLLNAPEEACAVCGEFIQFLSVPFIHRLTRSEMPAATTSLLSVDRGTWSVALKLQYCVHPTVCTERNRAERPLVSSPRVSEDVCVRRRALERRRVRVVSASSCTDVVACVGGCVVIRLDVSKGRGEDRRCW